MYNEHPEHRYRSVEHLVTDASFRSWVNQTDPAAVAYWDTLLQQHAYLQPLAEEAAMLVRQLRFRQNLPTAQETMALKQRIDAVLDNREAGYRSRHIKRVYYTAVAVAAVLLLLAGGIWMMLPNEKNTVIATAFAETKEAVLPDGSAVKLNAHSSIRYSPHWKTDGPREVWLTGEAFFQVAPAKGRSVFTVHAGELNITVLGTTFNVYNRHSQAAVVLESGKVKASTQHNAGTVLNPGQMIRLTAGALQLQQADTASVMAWRQNRMLFNNTTLSDIAQLLEDHFGCSVVWKNERYKNLRFTGSCANDNPALLFNAIAETYNIKVTHKGNTILFE